MWPAIPAGARLRVQLLDGDACSSGDIIYFARDDGYMAHRVVYHGWLGATGGYLLTRGDSCIVPDPPVVSSRVLGTVVAVEIDGGWRAPGAPGSTSVVGRVARIVSLATVTALLWVSPSAAGVAATAFQRMEAAWRVARQQLQ
jgi:hypothetical protein